MKIAFQMNPMESLDFTSDSSWQMMKEGSKRGEIYHFIPKNLSWQEGKILAKVNKVNIDDNKYYSEESKVIDLTEMDVIFIRQDPPYDMEYLTTTYLLEKITHQVLILNDPKAIRDFPEKISILDYPDIIPRSLVTSNLSQAIDFSKKHNKVILKPLYSFAGNDVFCLKFDDINFSNIFYNLISIYKAPLIVQEFLSSISDGDKRIILVDGDPVGAFTRIPKEGEIRANLACGGKSIPTELTLREKEICKIIKPKLLDNNLFLVGIDVIGGYLTEINVTSPTGIVSIQNFHNPHIVEDIWNRIEQKIKS